MKYREIFNLIIVLLFFSSCEKKDLKQSDISLVPVYNISNIQGRGNVAPFAIDVYMEKPIVIVYPTASELIVYEIKNYLDSSTDGEYDFTFIKSVQTTTEEGNNKIYAVETYEINGDINSGSGIMTIKSVNGNGNLSTKKYTVSIDKEKRYN